MMRQTNQSEIGSYLSPLFKISPLSYNSTLFHKHFLKYSSKWGTVDGFPMVFPQRSQEFGCTRPCRWYKYKPDCHETKNADHSYLRMVQERNNTTETSDTDDVIKV